MRKASQRKWARHENRTPANSEVQVNSVDIVMISDNEAESDREGTPESGMELVGKCAWLIRTSILFQFDESSYEIFICCMIYFLIIILIQTNTLWL